MKEFLYAMFHGFILITMLPFMIVVHAIGFIVGNLCNAAWAGYIRGHRYDPLKKYEDFKLQQYIKRRE